QSQPAKPSPPPPGNLKKVGSYQKDAPTPSSTGNDDYEKIQAGMSVEHGTFGKGTVQSVEGSGPNKKATVAFDSVGMKQLLLRFAKLRY
ncbi:MAG: ATP-dependent DNA helicase, partial [Bacteroidales bacterium]